MKGKDLGLPYSEVWAVDFEFIAPPGEHPDPVCMVAVELLSGETLRLWQDELKRLKSAPFDTGPGALFVAFFASAEIGCFLALGWPIPQRLLDLFTEFRAATNGLSTIAGGGLVGALAHYGVDTAGAVDEKGSMRALVMRGGPWSKQETADILAYCESDVRALARLLPEMCPAIMASDQRLGQALLRGRYMAAVARMEWNGIPIDVRTRQLFTANWERLQGQLIGEIDKHYGVYDGRSFRVEQFEAYLARTGIPWPRLDSGRLALSEEVFKQRAAMYPTLAPLRELRHALSDLRMNTLAVGSDGRNRTLLSPFRSKTGRNQPSNSMFIFGPSVWLRGLIKPERGRALAYLDWKSQEIAIAAALSDDGRMWAAYETGDPYMAFAKQAGLAPAEATKASHKEVRERCKVIMLGVQYGMSASTIAALAGIHEAEASVLLLRHKEIYRTFWTWAEQNVNAFLAGATLLTQYGWPIHLGAGVEARTNSILNWPMQANGAEMMRLACCEATEAGLKICAPIHDALLLEAAAGEIETHVDKLEQIMKNASRLVLGGEKTCGVDVNVVRYPERYSDDRGIEMWEQVMTLIGEIDPGAAH